MDKHTKEELRLWLFISLYAILTAILIILSTNAWGREKKVDPAEAYHQAVVQNILWLESRNQAIPCAYSGCTEWGPAQFKYDTFQWMKKQAKMEWLSWMEPADQVTLLDWAIRNGYGSHWTTFRRASEMALIQRYK